jgi:hypothetical protein
MNQPGPLARSSSVDYVGLSKSEAFKEYLSVARELK